MLAVAQSIKEGESMAKTKKITKPSRWSFVPSPETIKLYDALTEKLGALNKSQNIDLWVRLGISRTLANLNGGKPE